MWYDILVKAVLMPVCFVVCCCFFIVCFLYAVYKTFTSFFVGGKLLIYPLTWRLMWKKQEWCRYPKTKFFLTIPLFILFFDRIHESDRRTDRRTDTAWRHRLCLCIALRGKNYSWSTFKAECVTHNEGAMLQDAKNFMRSRVLPNCK